MTLLLPLLSLQKSDYYHTLCLWNPDKYFTWYMYGIYHTYTMYITYSGICMVYTLHIPGILNCSFPLVFRIILQGTHAVGVQKAMFTPENFNKAYLSFK